MLALGVLILLSSCGSSRSMVSTPGVDRSEYEGKRVQVIENPRSLEDFLIRAPGVYVRGSQVSIRGGGPPLFIVDGVRLGHSYSGVVSSINPLDIESVEVVSGPETAFYGREGSNGVIVIRTKS